MKKVSLPLQTTTYPEGKYYDKYSYGTSYNNVVADKRSKLGDAVKEVTTNANTNWYSDSGNVAYSSNPWLLRGGDALDETTAGAFSSNIYNADTGAFSSSRFVLTR